MPAGNNVVPKRVVPLGCAAMLLAGVALQIKYTAVVEGVFFGIMLLWAYRRPNRGLGAMLAVAGLWIGCALLPTALAALVYWRMGAFQPFLFANFFSTFGRVPDPFAAEIIGLIKLFGVLLPVLLFAGLSLRGRDLGNLAERFQLLWLGAAIAGVLLFGSFLASHYAMPILVPACIAAAPFFGRYRHARPIAGATLAVAAILGQLALTRSEVQHGGRVQALLVAQAAQPDDGCIYVYDGYPALYMLTHSCLPTRWVFPGHLNTSDEASAKAIGIDPATELRRILDTQPPVIVDDAPAYEFGNPETRAIVETTLARDYHLVASIKTGSARYRLVYRLNQAAKKP